MTDSFDRFRIPIGYRKDGRPIYLIGGGSEPPEPEPEPVPEAPEFHMPADLTLLTDEQVSEAETQAVARFRYLRSQPVSPERLTEQQNLSEQIDDIRSENTGRTARREEAARRAHTKMLEEQARLDLRVEGPPEPVTAEPVAAAAIDVETLTAAITASVGPTVIAALESFRDDNNKRRRGQTPARLSLQAAAEHTPTPRRRTLSVKTGVSIPGKAQDTSLSSLEDVCEVMNTTAKHMSVTSNGMGNRTLIATIENQEFEHTVDDRTDYAQMDKLFRNLTTRDNQEALVAGGGWCAPSEIRYSFFNVSCQDGLVDLPTFGVTRGGIRYPTSPSLADAVYTIGGVANQNFAGFGAPSGFSPLTVPWLWTETDDIATVTGAPNKPVIRVPCPGFSETRLECYGITMTAGNLTDDAYPEATANTLRLLNAAWSHAQNARIIATMIAASSAAILISGAANRPAYNQILSGMDMAATDYRAKFAMCDSDVLELVAPIWVSDVITADLAWRTKVDKLSVTLEEITGYFRDRNIRIQWVADWQVRGGAGTFGNPAALPGGAVVAWPTQADFLLYAAGTFIKGNGLTLDLGVVRDSVLNAENDFTAAWAEECHLVAKVGHESRRYTVGFVVDGADAGAVALGPNV